ncbi:MAG: hypothetical protein ACREVH_10775 [Gammaproteobacteria bacterium]
MSQGSAITNLPGDAGGPVGGAVFCSNPAFPAFDPQAKLSTPVHLPGEVHRMAHCPMRCE